MNGKKEKKYEMLIRRSKEIVNSYINLNIDLTIRQVYYQLVVNLDIPNNRSQYVYFDKVITDYRKQDLEFANLFIDDTRDEIEPLDIYYPYWKFNELINICIDKIKTEYPKFSYNELLLQDKINIILLEKRALKRIFEKGKTPNTMIVCSKGINSFTQMNDLRKLIENEKRVLNLYCFTDFDDTGMFIQENFISQMKEYLGIEFNSIERIALTQELIEMYKLPIDPTAKTIKQETSTHKDYNLPYFVELDAIEPNLLINLVHNTCMKNYNKNLYNAINKALSMRNRRLKKAYFRQLKKIDLSKI